MIGCSVDDLIQKYGQLIESGRKEGKELLIKRLKESVPGRRLLKQKGYL